MVARAEYVNLTILVEVTVVLEVSLCAFLLQLLHGMYFSKSSASQNIFPGGGKRHSSTHSCFPYMHACNHNQKKGGLNITTAAL